MFNRRLALALVVILSLVFSGVAMAQNPNDYPVSFQGVTPVLFADGPGGNVECSEVGDYEYASDRYSGTALPSGTFMTIDWTTDGEYVSWEGEHGGMAVIVKGGPGAFVYYYTLDPYYNSDSYLASPLNPGGQIPDVSNLTFCYNPPEVVCEWVGETAWAAGTRYVTRGNWATYTPYVAGSTVTLFAGQTMEAGTVTFSAPDGDGNVTITIELNDGWRLEDVEEAVKIQGYDSPPPPQNPAPGLFTTYKGNDLEVTVPAYAFYGVHVNVEFEVCP
jgi:hypothetical protein